MVDPDQWTVVDRYHGVIFPKHTQIVVAACVESIVSGKRLYLVSLHLKSGYADMEDRRCREFAKALKLVVTRFPQAVDSPLVVAGDLNSDFMQSQLIQAVLPTLRPPSFPKLKNAAAEANGIGATTPTYNYWHESVFDYILIS